MILSSYLQNPFRQKRVLYFLNPDLDLLNPTSIDRFFSDSFLYIFIKESLIALQMVTYNTIIKKFDQQGEKTGWTYIDIPADIAEQLNPGIKKSYRVKGKLDNYRIKGIAILPMGGGAFILPMNAVIRKGTGKKKGAMIHVLLEMDKEPFKPNPDFIECLADDPGAKKHFESLAVSHQNYFSKWIDAAKTEPTKIKRISMAINALSRNMGYPEMIRMNKKVS